MAFTVAFRYWVGKILVSETGLVGRVRVGGWNDGPEKVLLEFMYVSP